ncbi:uncharacterized protein J3R85_005533 [Psidium guajava]|nr:uncharacterized protein J3R85_005533 [Psidium guajava]
MDRNDRTSSYISKSGKEPEKAAQDIPLLQTKHEMPEGGMSSSHAFSIAGAGPDLLTSCL